MSDINYKAVQGFLLGFAVDSLNFCFILLLSNGCYIVRMSEVISMVVVSMQEYMKGYRGTVLLTPRDRKRAWLVLKRSGTQTLSPPPQRFFVSIMSESNSQTGSRNGNETSFPAPYYNCRALSSLGNGTSMGPPDSELERDVARRMWVT